MTARSAGFSLREQDGALALTGDWTVWTIAEIARPFAAAAAGLGPAGRIDIADLGRIDMAGAFLIDRAGSEVTGGREGAHKLIEAARAARVSEVEAERAPSGLMDLVERVGRAVETFATETLATLSFLGLTLISTARALARPHKIRWAAVFHVMETAGLNAVPIVAMLALFIGIVVAYLGAQALADFGQTLLTIELVSASMLRELGVIVAAVLLAGRTDSAFTAEIGAMRMRQEVDALRVLGMDPVDTLVVPRLIALVVVTPILTFVAMIAGIAGGMLVCWSYLNISPTLFITHVHNLPEKYFWGGIVKAPFFGFLLAQVGCRHGLQTGGDVASLGARVTSSVVQAIFLMLVLNAAFEFWLVEMGW
jgi:phospholipid/cholesterol/gamma-HCH transport system permease protein